MHVLLKWQSLKSREIQMELMESKPTKLNAVNVVIAASNGFFCSSISPNSSLIIVSIHTFRLAVITFTISSNSSALNPFFV